MPLNSFRIPVRPPLQGYHARIIAYLCVALTFAAAALEQSSGAITATLVIAWSLFYPHLAEWSNRRLAHRDSVKFRLLLLAIDALHCGVLVALIGFSLVPSMVFMLMLGFASSIAGGARYLIAAWLLAVAAALLAGQVTTATLNPAGSSLLNAASLIGGIAVIITQGIFLYRQGRHLEQAREQIGQQQQKSAMLAANLSKYLSPQVWESIFSGRQSVRLETRRRKLTVFFSDIRGFTELAEEMEPEALTDLLNNYLDEMSRIALEYGGTIDKFIGDCVMVFFGDPVTRGAKEDAEAAVSMAIAMRKHMKVLRQQWRSKGITRPLEIRMGLSTGYCTVGNFGAQSRMDYTIIGREVNLASRLESAAEAGEILIPHETWSLVKDTILCRDKGQINVKGFSRPVQIYQVVGLRRELGAAPEFVEHELPGFSMYLDTASIRNYDKEQIVVALEQAARKLRDKIIR
ncbi:adenylate/guanylate cyclase domain-containing protein [Halopseudomonas yangmingensis]|uniref:Adenylate cyclase, class 3 n=1 Tax=Halopseudomonas yangmingensis TaxID=1720063 RepID=A0A1I4S5D6_9GAMM|nr:adenylate/guanylate cyclase domain-containing protein [Halopseudomonas yangmingensis]SFM59707.1 Adenylate cyclase, class 3 [Halopseudomonas yangmingensis]